MQLTTILPTVLFSLQAYAAVNGHCSGSANVRGICLSTSTCTSNGGTYKSGACPNDPSNIKCCFISGCIDSSSFCTWTGTNNECSGIPQSVFVTNHCPGPSNYQCCNYGA
ncbi:hypothetical protein F5882DRAFT_423572 [Hyaloscypha sp. PMI_1271]|nr:hypothetical protein F5882DRAFT_423572 [Hyaloscypha sp. PMI_1271]